MLTTTAVCIISLCSMLGYYIGKHVERKNQQRQQENLLYWRSQDPNNPLFRVMDTMWYFPNQKKMQASDDTPPSPS